MPIPYYNSSLETGSGSGITQEELNTTLSSYTTLSTFNSTVEGVNEDLADKEEILTFGTALGEYSTNGLLERVGNSVSLIPPNLSLYATTTQLNLKEDILTFNNDIFTPYFNGKIEREGDTITYFSPDFSQYLTTETASTTYATIASLDTKEEILNFGTALDEYSTNGELRRTGNNVIYIPKAPAVSGVNIVDTNTDGTYYPVFVESGGLGTTLRADTTTLPFSVNPNNGNFNVADTIKIDQGRVAVGKNAGLTNQGSQAVAIGKDAGETNQGAEAIGIGKDAGKTDQKAYAVSIGLWSGSINQGQAAVAIGTSSGNVNQGIRAVAIGQGAGAAGVGSVGQGANAVAVGLDAGNFGQGGASVGIGPYAGFNSQQHNSVAIGNGAGFQSQKNNAIAIGMSSGEQTQGVHSIAIGTLAGFQNQHDYSIVLNATGTTTNTAQASSFFVNPIRQALNPASGSHETGSLWYNTTTKEICYNP